MSNDNSRQDITINKKVVRKQRKNNEQSKKSNYSISELEEIKKNEQVVEMYVDSVDENLNLIGIIGKEINAIMPRDEISTVVGDDGLVSEKHVLNKKGRIIESCIKDIYTENGKTTVVLSRKILELKVRRWMYMHLKPGIKMKGIVRSVTEYAAFVDVGGGVTGILKSPDISDMYVSKVSDIIKPGKRLNVIVKKYDRDTGRIELRCNEFENSYEKMIKNLSEGDIIEGVVKSRSRTGIFIEIKPNLLGIAEHMSGIEEGQKVLVSIKRIIPEKKKIKLVIIG